MRNACGPLAVLVLALVAPPAFAGKTLAFFGFELDNTSPAPSSPAELARTAGLTSQFAALMAKSGAYTLVDATAATAALLKANSAIRDCNGCELDAAKGLKAQYAGYGWVQKVSNLILNLNIVIEDVASGKQVAGGSVDIRGNTDESFARGLDFLVQEHVLPR